MKSRVQSTRFKTLRAGSNDQGPEVIDSESGTRNPELEVGEAGRKAHSALVVSQVSRFWLYATGMILVIGAVSGSQPLFGLGLLVAASLVVSWLWARWCLRNLTVERRFSHRRAFWGEEVDMSQVFSNAKPLPVPWLSVEDQMPGSLQLVTSASDVQIAIRRKLLYTALSLGWYEWVTRHYRIKCMARGEHEFGPVELQSGDVFGLFRRTESRETAQTLLVYPRYVPVQRLGIPARQPFGDFKATQHLATDPLRIRGVREYVYGDVPRYVHWKATARRGVLQTKLFDPAATPKLFIFCNQDTFAHIWQGIDPETLELTITVAASLANHALEEGYQVGLQVNSFAPSSDRQVKLPPSRDPGQLTRILENLALVKGWSGLPMEDLIRAERRALPLGATIVVVTGIVTDDMLAILMALRRAGHPVTLVETLGSKRGSQAPRPAPGEALAMQGITYYLVEAVEGAAEIEELSF
jgi:uncharacterized protein (DUF58 family)